MSASKRRKRTNQVPEFILHLTPASNLESISTHGLLPSIGPLSKLSGEVEPLIHLYDDIHDFGPGLLRWMGSLLGGSGEDGHGAIALLAIDSVETACASRMRGDYVSRTAIAPACIDIVSLDISPSADIDSVVDDFMCNRVTAKDIGMHCDNAWRALTMSERHRQMAEASTIARTFVSRRGGDIREDVAQLSLFTMERPSRRG